MAHVGFAAGYLPLPERLRVGEYLRDVRPALRPAPTRTAPGARGPGALRHRAPGRGHGHRAVQRARRRWSASSRRPCTTPSCWSWTSRPPASTPTWPCGSAPACAALCDERGTALLVTSHNMVEVERLARAGRVPVRRPGGRRRPAAEVAARFGRDDLEEVFLHLASAPGQRAHRGAAAMTAQGSDGGRPGPGVAELAPWLRILAVARRHAYVLQRSPHRLFDVTVWPIVDTLLFGSLGVFFARQGGPARPPRPASPTCCPGSCSGTSSTRRRSPSRPASWRRPGRATCST